MTIAMAMILGVGPDQVPVTATFSTDGGFSIELEKEVKLCKLTDVLDEYGIDSSSWPSFLQNLAAVDVWLWQLEAKTDRFAELETKDVNANTTLDSFKPTSGKEWSIDQNVRNKVKVVKKDDKSYSFEFDTKSEREKKAAKAYELKETGTKLELRQKIYTIVISGNYAEPLPLIRGMIDFHSFTVGISNDPKNAENLTETCKKRGNQLRERFLEQKKLAGELKEMQPPALPPSQKEETDAAKDGK